MKQINENMHGSIGSIGSFDRLYMVDACSQMVDSQRNCQNCHEDFCSGISNLPGKEEWAALGECLKRKKHERWNST